jgi:hypothetical protein
MLLEALRLALALALLVLLPGWLLVRAVVPARGVLTRAQEVYLALGGGILVTMLVGIALGFAPHPNGRGALQSLATGGMPNVELAMLGACLVLFWIGAARGAYPRVSSRFPRLVAPWAHLKTGQEQP